MQYQITKLLQSKDSQPGKRHQITHLSDYIKKDFRGSEQLKGKVALITGGDSGIGRAVAVAFAAQGADVLISYLNEDGEAKKTQELVQAKGGKSKIIKGDISEISQCKAIISEAMDEYGHLDVIVNNSAIQYPQDDLQDIPENQLLKNFGTNIFSYFFVTKAALPHLKKGASIINTSSVTAYRGRDHLIDDAATKGAIVSFTRSLSTNLASKGIRINVVAPDPIWTALMPASFPEEHVTKFGQNSSFCRSSEYPDAAPCFVFLASDASSNMTGQILDPNCLEIINT